MRTRQGSRTGMFLRMLLRASAVRRGRTIAALVAIIVAAAVSTAMLTLYVDLDAKLRKEFRSYGANLVVIAAPGSALRSNALDHVDAALGERGIAVPFAYAVARTASGQPVVVAGTDLERVRRLDKWWSVSAWPHTPGQALVGARALPVVAPDGKMFTLSFAGRTMEVNPAGTVRTGAAEDSRIYLNLGEFVRWTGVQASSIEVGATGSAAEIEATQKSIAAALPEAEVRPVRQIVEAESRVLDKTRASLLASALVIILTTALCVLATLTASVLDRGCDFALMKALGASERLVSVFFMAEATAIGLMGAVAGFGVGIGVAVWIGRASFAATIAPRLSIFPVVLGGSIALALLSAALPLALLRRVQPATILRGA